MGTVTNLYRYEPVQFPWGTAVREIRTGKWLRAFLRPNQEINLEGYEVEMHDNGIEFFGLKR